MASIKDDRGYNQGFAPSKSTIVRMERRANLLLSEMDLTPDTRILEIGCGTGEMSHQMAQKSPAHVTGIDICVPFIEEARKKYQSTNLHYAAIDFNDSRSLADAQFDYIVGNGILHHLYSNIDGAFANMRRLLKKDGKILFLEPNIRNPYVYFIFSYIRLRMLANLEPGEMAFSKRFITNVLKRAGFEKIRVDYKDFLLPGIPDFLIAPSIAVGSVLEKFPPINQVAQSIFIRANKFAPAVHETTPQPFSRLAFLIRYGISGVIGGVIQVFFLYVWVTLLGFEKMYILGLGLGFIVALTVAFALQKYWAFRDDAHDRIPSQLFSYSAVAVSGLALNTLLLAGAKMLFELFSLDFFHGWYLIAQTLIVCIVAIFNFAMNFLFTFRHSRQRRSWER